MANCKWKVALNGRDMYFHCVSVTFSAPSLRNKVRTHGLWICRWWLLSWNDTDNTLFSFINSPVIGTQGFLLCAETTEDYTESVLPIASTSIARSKHPNVITALKAIFSRHRVPTSLVTDNGPQYAWVQRVLWIFTGVMASQFWVRVGGIPEIVVSWYWIDTVPVYICILLHTRSQITIISCVKWLQTPWFEALNLLYLSCQDCRRLQKSLL